MKAFLVHESRVFPINSKTIKLGRDLENTLVLSNKTVSRFHARITLEEGIFFLEDLGSRSGTLLNEFDVTQPVPLSSGDLISLAEVDLFFYTDLDDIEPSTKQRTTNLMVDEEESPDKQTPE